MKWLLASCCTLMLFGCKGLKERQLGSYIGDTQTKVFYKNTTELHNQIPKERQITFRSYDSAVEAGYSPAADVGKATSSDSDE